MMMMFPSTNHSSSMSFALLWSTFLLSFTVKGQIQREDYFASSSLDDAQIAYTNWLSTSGTFYNHSVFMSSPVTPSTGVAIFWEFVSDDDDDLMIGNTTGTTNATKVQFGVIAPTYGWIAFGISQSGGMADSDIVLYDSINSPDNVLDYYIPASSNRVPMIDICQNWELIDATLDSGLAMIEVVRDLNTMDTQDLVIVEDIELGPTILIAAWGDSNFGYHGPANKASAPVFLFEDAVAVDIDVTAGITSVPFGTFPDVCV